MATRARSRTASRRPRLWLWLLALPLIWVLGAQIFFLAQILWWRSHNPQDTAFMRIQLAQLQEHNPQAQLQQRWVAYGKIANTLKHAVVASEDDGFVDHEGVDWEALHKAYEKNQRKGKVVAGGSTITQQLAKNLFLSGERSYWRKAQELVIAYMLEACLDKRRILEIYLNVVEWGVGVFGAEAAAQHYFGIPASQLSGAQAARLAVMLPRPRYYDKNRGSAYLQKRSESIQKRMYDSELP